MEEYQRIQKGIAARLFRSDSWVEVSLAIGNRQQLEAQLQENEQVLNVSVAPHCSSLEGA